MNLINILKILGGLGLLVVGAEALVRGSVLLARRARIGSLVIGLTVVAFGTSAPELVVSAQAALAGSGGLALGNVVGSNIANVLLILGVAACVRPLTVQSQVIRIDIPIMIAVSFLTLPVLLDGGVSRPEGAVLLLGVVGYTGLALWLARRERTPDEEQSPRPEDSGKAASGSLPLQLGLIVVGLASLIAGANLLIGGAIAVAAALGVSQALIGLTIVAVGTSLPELVTSVVATVRNESDLAVGNVVGSNIFNLLAILGISALLRPLDASGIALSDYLVMIVAALVLLPLSWTGRRLTRLEGVFLLIGYVAYVAFRAVWV